MSADEGELEIVRWYTRARKFPQLIGKTPDGARLPGGPYTYTQVIVAAVLLYAGSHSISLWGRFGIIGNVIVLLGGTYAIVLALGRLPIGTRSPWAAAGGLQRAFSTPPLGRVAGRPLRVRKPHLITTRLVISPAPAAAAEPGHQPPVQPERPQPEPPSGPPGTTATASLNDIQRRLAGSLQAAPGRPARPAYRRPGRGS